MWDILRTAPAGLHPGKSIPVFINNAQQHHVTLDVYADGAVDAWGFLDLPLFDAKLERGWISTAPPDGSRLSVFGLGSATVSHGEWSLSTSELRELVWAIVRGYDPGLQHIIDMEGSDTITVGRARQSKMDMARNYDCRPDPAGGPPIRGTHLHLFRQSGTETRLHPWFIYADGISRIGVGGELQPLEHVYEEIQAGTLDTHPGTAEWIIIPGLGRFRPERSNWRMDASEVIREADDALVMLSGRPGAVQVCRQAFRDYTAEPSAENLERLREAYEAVPARQRPYCGDMDSRDIPIRRALGLE